MAPAAEKFLFRCAASRQFLFLSSDKFTYVGMCAHKIGEVVEPAGGETGVPRCLAEDRKLRKAVNIHKGSVHIREQFVNEFFQIFGR